MVILTPGQIQRLKEHNYAAQGMSVTMVYLHPFWNWVVTLTPMWMAPNLITILGLITNAFTAFWVLWYSPDYKGDNVPSYVFYACTIGLLIYQTLDAIDGKQARRTGSSSPMGELFDHGCDAVSTILVTVSVACALSLGSYPDFLFFFFIHNVALFYLAHWQTYCTGYMICETIDVIEGQVLSCIAYIIAGYFGSEIFLNRVLNFNFTYAKLLMGLLGTGTLLYVKRAFHRIFHGGCGKNGTTVAHTSVLSPIVPMGIVLASALYVYKHSIENVFEVSPALFILMFGTSTSKLTCNLV